MAAEADAGVFSIDDKAELISEEKDAASKTTQSESPASDGSIKKDTALLHKLSKKTLQSGKSVAESHGLKVIIAVAVVFSFVITVSLILTIYLAPPQVGAHGGVAADIPECSDMGLDILQKGGNSVDAAVTTMLCVGVFNAQSSGIGGGGFMLVHNHKTHKAEMFDFRETAPAAATPNMLDSLPLNTPKGGLFVAVPGELKGMEVAHTKYGKLSWYAVVSPVAERARNGFRVTESLADALETKMSSSDFTGNFGKYYILENGQLPKAGTSIKRPDLAATLDIIAEKGSTAFYNGELTDGIVKSVKKAGGILTKEDLNNYEVIIRDVIQTTYHDHTIETLPSPSSGPILLAIMNILEGYEFDEDSYRHAVTYHQIIEAFKFAYAQQAGLADPDKVSSVGNFTKNLISKDVAERMRNLTTNSTHKDQSYYGQGKPFTLDRGASHISVVDSDELFVSVTTTLNTWFGSKVMTNSGILLNNEMADFSTDPSSNNAIEPGKRPLSNMAPTLLYNADHVCSIRVVLGAANGSSIVTGIVETLLNTVSFGYGKNLTNAIEAPRFHTAYYEDKGYITEYEDKFHLQLVTELQTFGHNMIKSSDAINTVQGILKVKDQIVAHSDSRNGGRAASFK